MLSLLLTGLRLSLGMLITIKSGLSPCGQDDDLGPGWSHTHLHTGVAILSKLASQELVQLGLEDTVWDELRREDRVSFTQKKDIFITEI